MCPDLKCPPQNLSKTMGSKSSKPSKAPNDPYRDLADRAARNINVQYPDGMGHAQIAAAVPNPKSKDPLIMMLRQNEEGKYAYDQEYYDRCDELLKNDGAGVWDRRHRRKRRSGIAEGTGRHGEEQVEKKGDGKEEGRGKKVPAGSREDLGGQKVYAAAGEQKGGKKRGAGERSDRDEDESGDGGGRSGDKRDTRPGSREGTSGFASRGEVGVDKRRRAFVHRKK